MSIEHMFGCLCNFEYVMASHQKWKKKKLNENNNNTEMKKKEESTAK